ncbi:MAG: hypothetical protein P4L50_10210 [Anaerolineaceae bacterium]|nr:hypothetical protein [Anaerolineaceae bacterium]
MASSKNEPRARDYFLYLIYTSAHMASLANYFIRGGGVAFASEYTNRDVSSAVVIANGANQTTHSVTADGTYNVQDQNGNTLLAFANNALSAGSAVYNHIADVAAPINATLASHTATLANHETRLTTIETSGGGGGGSIPGLSSVLTTSNDASNQPIENVSILEVNSHLSISGLHITANVNNVVMPNVSTGVVICDQLYLNNVDLNTRISNIETYINNLKYFYSVLSQGVNITDPNTGQPFNFSNLL